MDLCVGDLLSCFIAQHSANMALIKLSLIKVSLILLARLIDLICLSSTIGYDLYLVNELIDLAQVHLEESKRILTCCPFNLAHSGHSLGHDGNALAKVWRGGELLTAIFTPCGYKHRVDLGFCTFSVNGDVALAMTLLMHHSSVTFTLGKNFKPTQNLLSLTKKITLKVSMFWKRNIWVIIWS